MGSVVWVDFGCDVSVKGVEIQWVFGRLIIVGDISVLVVILGV
jgi:hypothetical protein